MPSTWPRRAIALALLPALVACGMNPTSTITVRKVRTVSPAPRVSVRPTQMPEGRPSLPIASPAPTPAGASPTPVTGASPLARGKVLVNGYVFDDDSALIAGATVTARSLDPAVPFRATTTTQSGAFLFRDVPEAVNIEVTVAAPGWTGRRRVKAFAADTAQANRCDFGAPDGDVYAEGAAYFVSNRPEIVRTEPADRDANVSPLRAAVKLVTSEPLDAVNRARLERAVRLLPANDVANGHTAGTTTDVRTLADVAYPRVIAVDGNPLVAPYAIQKGSIFLDDTTSAATCQWNAQATELTLSLPGPLQSDATQTAAYQLVLVSGGPNEAIRDADGHMLGSGPNGGTDAYPPAGNLVPGAFLSTSLQLRAIAGLMGPPARWAATHDDNVRFGVVDAPGQLALQGVQVRTLGNDTRIELAFSRALAAYDGTPHGFSHASITTADVLAHLTFALAESSVRLAGVPLDREPAAALGAVDPRVQVTLGADTELERPFRFAPAAYVPTPTGAPAGSVAVTVDPLDARRLFVTIVGRPHFFDAQVGALAAHASDLSDPAGHRLSDAVSGPYGPIATF